MPVFMFALLVAGAVLAAIGYHIVHGSGPTDERLGGAFFYLGAIVCFILGGLVAVGIIIFGGH